MYQLTSAVPVPGAGRRRRGLSPRGQSEGGESGYMDKSKNQRSQLSHKG